MRFGNIAFDIVRRVSAIDKLLVVVPAIWVGITFNDTIADNGSYLIFFHCDQKPPEVDQSCENKPVISW